MYYENLNELLYNSNSTRKYFLNLPVKMQMNIHEFNNEIHSAFQLRLLKERLDSYNHKVKISELNLF